LKNKVINFKLFWYKQIIAKRPRRMGREMYEKHKKKYPRINFEQQKKDAEEWLK